MFLAQMSIPTTVAHSIQQSFLSMTMTMVLHGAEMLIRASNVTSGSFCTMGHHLVSLGYQKFDQPVSDKFLFFSFSFYVLFFPASQTNNSSHIELLPVKRFLWFFYITNLFISCGNSNQILCSLSELFLERSYIFLSFKSKKEKKRKEKKKRKEDDI